MIQNPLAVQSGVKVAFGNSTDIEFTVQTDFVPQFVIVIPSIPRYEYTSIDKYDKKILCFSKSKIEDMGKGMAFIGTYTRLYGISENSISPIIEFYNNRVSINMREHIPQATYRTWVFDTDIDIDI